VILLINNDLLINTQTSSYTLALSDDGKLVDMNSGSALTVTVPKASVVPFAIGAVIAIRQAGAGQVTITPVDGTVIINNSAGLKTASQYGMASLVKLSQNTWTVTGNLGS
jgi:hypothetical protein